MVEPVKLTPDLGHLPAKHSGRELIGCRGGSFEEEIPVVCEQDVIALLYFNNF